MTSERAQAYGRVVHTLDRKGSSRLRPGEQQRVRDAADSLFFTDDPAGADAEFARADVGVLAEHLVESERWEEPEAHQLLEDVRACGPVAAPVAA